MRFGALRSSALVWLWSTLSKTWSRLPAFWRRPRLPLLPAWLSSRPQEAQPLWPPIRQNWSSSQCPSRWRRDPAGSARWGTADRARASHEQLVVEHDLFHSREKVGFQEFNEGVRALRPPALQVLVRRHERTGRRALYLASHASRIIGRGLEEGRALLRQMIGEATRREFVYAHQWQPGDLLMRSCRPSASTAAGVEMGVATTPDKRVPSARARSARRVRARVPGEGRLRTRPLECARVKRGRLDAWSIPFLLVSVNARPRRCGQSDSGELPGAPSN